MTCCRWSREEFCQLQYAAERRQVKLCSVFFYLLNYFFVCISLQCSVNKTSEITSTHGDGATAFLVLLTILGE